MSRDIRRIMNSVEPPQTFSEGTPASSLQEGGTIVSLDNGRLAVRRKHKGIIFKTLMSRDGNEIVDKKLSANELEYRRRFIDYRYFNHNFKDDIGTTKHYLPWSGVGEQTTGLSEQSSFLAPFKMICHKLIIRPENMNDNTQTITFGIERIDNGDTTQDSIATFAHTTDFVASTVTVINNSDWSASPVVPANALATMTIQTSSSDLQDGESTVFWITSVWKTFIEV